MKRERERERERERSTAELVRYMQGPLAQLVVGVSHVPLVSSVSPSCLIKS